MIIKDASEYYEPKPVWNKDHPAFEKVNKIFQLANELGLSLRLGNLSLCDEETGDNFVMSDIDITSILTCSCGMPINSHGKMDCNGHGNKYAKTSQQLEVLHKEEYKQTLDRCVVIPGGHVEKKLYDIDRPRLYPVTTIERRFGHATPMIADSFEKANEAILSNLGDMFEGSYHLVVIEPIFANVVYVHPEEQYWYKWIDYDIGYQAIEWPEEYKLTCGWGVG